MELKKLAGAIVLCLVPALAHAVERGDFELETTHDLLDVCMVDESDPLAREAANGADPNFLTLEGHLGIPG